MAPDALIVEDAEAIRIARELSQQTGRTESQVIADALRHEASQFHPRLRGPLTPKQVARAEQLLAEIRALPDNGPEAVPELYDENGLFS